MLTFKQLREANERRCPESFHPLNHWNILEWSGCVAGEAGEAVNKAKKIRRIEDSEAFSPTLPKHKTTLEAWAEELADTVIYADLAAASQGVDLEEVIAKKFNTTSVQVASSVFLYGDTLDKLLRASLKEHKATLEAMSFPSAPPDADGYRYLVRLIEDIEAELNE